MLDLKSIFIAANRLKGTPDYGSGVKHALIHAAESFARISYQSVYLLDFSKQEFLFVSDNPLFLCGHTAQEVKDLGYNFFIKHVPEDELKKLVELNVNGFKLFSQFDDASKFDSSISFDYHLKNDAKSILVNQQSTPILLNEEGKIWIGLNVVSLSSHRTAGHAEFHKRGQEAFWEFSFDSHRWIKRKGILLKKAEIEVLRLSAAGLNMSEIADVMCRSIDTIKYYKRQAFEKLEVRNITEAISRAILYRLF